jgi:hypothetical protein
MNKPYAILTSLLVLGSLLCFWDASARAQTPVEEKVGVLLTGWGMPAGYNFSYAFTSGDYARIGDRTEYEGQPCKIGHVGTFPYLSHIYMIPWAITFPAAGYELFYDSYGIYQYDSDNDTYVSPIPGIPPVAASSIPTGTPVIPLDQVTLMGVLQFPPDPRDSTDYLDGWYQIGNYTVRYPNGYVDIVESTVPSYIRYYGLMCGPTSPPEVVNNPPTPIQQQDDYLDQLLQDAFGDRIDVRRGFYTAVEGYTQMEDDVAEAFAGEGFTKLLLARETTDHNRYANEFMTGNYIKERLCEIGELESMQIQQTRQVGRTPEFNAMNIANLQTLFNAYPAGSTIGVIYVTRGLPWGKEEAAGPDKTAHPWSKEVYHENAYLNYISWKRAVTAAYGDRYNLVFTKGGRASDLRADNYFTYGVNKQNENGSVYIRIRDAIQTMKGYGIENILVVPCHWNYDNLDTIFFMKDVSGLPLTPKADILAGKFDYTHCEDSTGNVVACDNPAAVATVTVAQSYSGVPEAFATAYYVVLRGTLERFGLYPSAEEPTIAASQLVTKAAGGTVEVSDNATGIQGAKIIIPADPYPTRPEDFTYLTAIPVNDPGDTYDCLWEDTVINIGRRATPPAINGAQAVGPAVYFGPYRTFFNRDVSVTIPYDSGLAGAQPVAVYVYNHVTQDWDPIAPASVDPVSNRVTFSTQTLGLFQATIGDFDRDGIDDATDNCPFISNPAQTDTDGDTVGNACENCWAISNPTQLDTNGNCPAPPYASDPKCGDACNVCMADFDNNGKTNLTDLGILKGEFGRTNCRTVPPACRADTNADGKVNLTDLGKLKSEFGKTNCFQ